jgi:hypothetical protein
LAFGESKNVKNMGSLGESITDKLEIFNSPHGQVGKSVTRRMDKLVKFNSPLGLSGALLGVTRHFNSPFFELAHFLTRH